MNQYDTHTWASLFSNIYLIGQGSGINGIQKRIEHELSMAYNQEITINKYFDNSQSYNYVHSYNSLYKFYMDFDLEKH